MPSRPSADNTLCDWFATIMADHKIDNAG